MFFALGSFASAQQQGKVIRIGEIVFRSRPDFGPGRTAFRQQLRELGYVEGKNVAFESPSAEGKLERFRILADELVRLKVDVFFASSTNEAQIFKNATPTIPIVFRVWTDPVAAGLVDSLARPGGNITGVTTISAVLVGKRLELLKETVPKLSRVAALWEPPRKLRTIVETKPNAGARTWFTASFHGSQQRRQIRGSDSRDG